MGTPVDFKTAIDAVEADGLDSSIRIRLVDANGLQIQGVVSTSGKPVTTNYEIDLWHGAETATLELVPQSQIARPDGVATWYQIDIRIGSNVASYRVQVPDSVETQDLLSLIGAAAIDPADITAGRLIPPGGTDGQVLAKAADTDYAVEWVTGGGAVGHDPVTVADSTSIDITLTGQQISAAAIFGTSSGTVTQGNDSRLSDARTPNSHAASHQNGGTDEIATATAAANAIPKAGAGSTLEIGWLPVGTVAGTVAAGDDSRFTAITAVGSGVNFFPTDTSIIPAGTDNTYPVKTLSNAPSGAAEDVDSIVIPAGTTVMYGTYLSPVLLNEKLDGGIWEFHVYAGVDSATGTTTLTQNVYRVRPASGTVTITGTGTSRTATASTGTPFATTEIDASAAIENASFVQTPLGLYPITARTSDTVVTITTPSGYTNESAVDFSVHKKLFGVTSGEINNLAGAAPAYTGIMLLPEMQSVQADIPLATGDRLASAFLGTSTSSRTLYFAHDGTVRYSHFHSPLTFVVDLESGVSGVLPEANGGTGEATNSALAGVVRVARTAGATLAARDLCVLNASSQMVLADASAEATSKGLLGIAAAAINSAASGTIIHRGSVAGFTGLTAGAVYYISTTAGGITTTPPSAAGEFVRVVGYAESTTSLWFDPSGVWLEIQ